MSVLLMQMQLYGILFMTEVPLLIRLMIALLVVTTIRRGLILAPIVKWVPVRRR